MKSDNCTKEEKRTLALEISRARKFESLRDGSRYRRVQERITLLLLGLTSRLKLDTYMYPYDAFSLTAEQRERHRLQPN